MSFSFSLSNSIERQRREVKEVEKSERRIKFMIVLKLLSFTKESPLLLLLSYFLISHDRRITVTVSTVCLNQNGEEIFASFVRLFFNFALKTKHK
jgi:hypothetical protein